MILISSVKAENGWLGNMSPFPIEHEDKTFRTTEALFQYLRFTDDSIIEEIRSRKSPMSAKMATKKNRSQMIIEPMGEKDLDNMRCVLRLKIEQHPELIGELLATGQEEIIEDCTKRPHGSGKFWGAAFKDSKWIGENWLGFLWMEIREELRGVCLK
ncbi:MAG TPA: DUF1768 domain-containing protein [Planctomycetaceae bacterium]|nr:DUF1768 domain-containing protein [Planctomycetaceae bacterium]